MKIIGILFFTIFCCAHCNRLIDENLDEIPSSTHQQALKDLASAIQQIYTKALNVAMTVLHENETELVRLMKWAMLLSIKRAVDRVSRGEWPQEIEQAKVEFELPQGDSSGFCGRMDPNSHELPSCVTSIEFSNVPVSTVPIKGQTIEKNKNMVGIIGSISGISRLTESDDYSLFENANNIRGRLSIMPPKMEIQGKPIELPVIAKQEIEQLMKKMQKLMDKSRGFMGLIETTNQLPNNPPQLLQTIEAMQREGSGWLSDDVIEGSGFEANENPVSKGNGWNAQILLDMFKPLPPMFGQIPFGQMIDLRKMRKA